MTPEQAAEIIRINAALLAALSEAQGKLEANAIDADLVDLVLHAKELHELLAEALLAAEPDIAPGVRGLGAVMGKRIALLVELLEGVESSDGRTLQ